MYPTEETLGVHQRFVSVKQLHMYLDDSEADEASHVYSNAQHVVLLHPLEDRFAWFQSRVQMQKHRPIADFVT